MRGQIQSLKVSFQSGFISYQADNSFSKECEIPGERDRNPGWSAALED